MPDGNVRQNEKSIGYVGRDERNIARRIDVGGWQQGRNGDWHPEAEIGHLGSERDEYGILSIRFDGLGAVSERDPQRGGLTLVGANATARLHLPSDDLFSFDLTLTAPQLAAFTSRGELRLPFDVTGGRGLKWLYQTPLTNAIEIEPGILEGLDGGDTVRRPVWADGSYAVYHTSLRNDRNDGFGNWRRAGTGKICHVRRPHVTDLATGDVLWGQVEVADGELALVFDALLFNGRTGPFVFDPDVGTTGVGASSFGPGSGRQSMYGWLVMPEDGTITSVSAYASNTLAANREITLGLCADSGGDSPTGNGDPETLLADGAGVTVLSLEAGAWHEDTLDSGLARSTGNVVWILSNHNANQITYWYDASAGGEAGEQFLESSITYVSGTLSSVVTPASNQNRACSEFFSYTASGGGGSILPLVAADMANISDMGGMRG